MPHDKDKEQRERLAALVLCRTKLDEQQVEALDELFSELVKIHQAALLRQIQQSIKDVPAAEDIAQEVFFTFQRKVLEEGFPDEIGGLLHAIADGLIFNHKRAARRSILSVGLPSSSSEPPRTGPGADQVVIGRELSHQLFASLTPDHQDVVDAVIVQRMSHTEAAALLGLRLGTLKSRLKAAVERLQALADELLPKSQQEAS